MLLYYVVLKPLRLLPVSEEVKRKYREAGLHCRFSYFSVTTTGWMIHAWAETTDLMHIPYY